MERNTQSTPLRHLVVLFTALAAIFTFSACGDDDDSGPEEPTFTFVIPAGAGEQIEAGEPLDILPRELRTEIGETIMIINEDDEAHILGPWFLAAGETLRQRFVTPGVFEGSCSVHPSGAFTVVVEPTDEA